MIQIFPYSKVCLAGFRAFASALLTILALSSCQTQEPEADVSRAYPVTFDLSAFVEGIAVDSIQIEIAINDGLPQALTVNLVSGESESEVLAKPGDAFQLRFSLYSGGIRIGQGVIRGLMAADIHQVLEPVFDPAAIAQIKQSLSEGLYLPADLPDRYGLAIAGSPLYLRLDSAESIRFKWTVSPEGEIPSTGEGTVFIWTPSPASVGKAVPVKVEAWKGSIRAQERNWSIRVIRQLPVGRLSGYTTRNDTSALSGSLTRFTYSPGLMVRQTFGSLDPARDASPVEIDSVQTDASDRPLLVRTRLGGGATVDSAFSWSAAGRLLSLTVREASTVSVDSFSWDKDDLRGVRRFVRDTLVEWLVHRRDKDQGSDTLFTRGPEGKLEMSRVFRLRYQGDSLAEKTWYVLRNSWVAYRRETFTYTGIGSLLRYRRFRESERSEPDVSALWFYDETGKLLRQLERDDVDGRISFAQDYTWDRSLAKRSALATPSVARADRGIAEALSTLKLFNKELSNAP
ncbi:MAG: hypothetical protein ABI036_00020 [Fibrobacteria bacterium]